ncbi:phage Gp37/Gp68 family protein [Desulfovibrio sulfodismutans]|uniref:Phage Gp37/Gp68 family protein n=1 Tax=Desulfolutivibrio sulfodismutans TaxID=63561 RepID=A0A7K3NJ51_9BACT|nr:phage Gp37/Gp68 family protein [Desulfolutivibrio sulfodismutans]NDY56224.1 phage Gp37/Gp68 family protein [Desulfolutivibrio sulfodismutans]QLA11284.1 DUF5131 family protein [Desulfolutivibrio sulfodismutans DSM 3696]
MGDKSKIEWCDATWNPVVGCSRISPGCDHCYASRMACRLAQIPTAPHQYREVVDQDNQAWNGRTEFVTSAMEQPFRWKRGRHIFVGSMTDLFHPSTPDEWLDRIFAVMALTARHRFLLLAKRPERMRDYMTQVTPQRLAHAATELQGEEAAKVVLAVLNDTLCGVRNVGWPMRHVWLGVTAEDQARADERIPILRDTPAVVRFVSFEPLLGQVDCRRFLVPLRREITPRGRENVVSPPGVNWAICGGESGPGARPMHPDWVRGLRGQCQDADVPFFFKSWGDWRPGLPNGQQKAVGITPNGGTYSHDAAEFFGETWPDNARCMARVGKKSAGRMLDGKTWDEVLEPNRSTTAKTWSAVRRKKCRAEMRADEETIAAGRTS